MEGLLGPLSELWATPGVQENLEESGRIFFSNNALTVNLIPALIIIGLLSLLLKPLFGISILDGLLGGGSSGASYGSNLEVSDGYGAPSQGYGAPDAGYGAPDAGYGAPAPSYDAPAPSYDAPAPSYDAPSSNSYDAPSSNSYDAPSSNSYDAPQDQYGRRRRAVDLPREARELYKELAQAGPGWTLQDIVSPDVSLAHQQPAFAGPALALLH